MTSDSPFVWRFVATLSWYSPQIAALTEFTGDPARYFYGVAKNIYLEYQREIIAKHRRIERSSSTNGDDEHLRDMLKQLDDALNAIPKSDRELILTYYTGTGRSKIDHRRALATQFGVRPNALRLRVCRIRRTIRLHMLEASAAELTLITRA